jgi:2-methylisocitrate lyase-like PEP mutase family enzyme
MTDQGRRLRDLLAEPGLLRAPGAYDGISAHLVRRAGFRVAYMTGAGVAASGHGLPDIGLVTASEMVARLAVIAEASGLPVIADADTGYGSPLHVVRTVRDYERAGAAAIQLEDQAFPKRCGHLDDKQLIGTEEFVRKLHSAVDARRHDTLIVARTDARGPVDLDEAIARARRYEDEGADMLFVEAPQSLDEIERIARELRAPLLFNVVPGGKTPQVTDAELERLGYKVAIYPGAVLAPATGAALAALAQMSGQPAGEVRSPLGVFGLVGLEEWTQIDRRLGAPRAEEEPAWA